MADPKSYDIPIYSSTARFYHWLVVALIAIQFPIGYYMKYRAYDMPYKDDKGEAKVGLFDALTGQLYDSHKLIGVIILLVVLARLFYRFSNGAPPSDSSLESWQKGASHAVHWSIYALLIIVPIGGYIGASYYGALNLFGAIPLPMVTPKDEKMSEAVFQYHYLGAFILLCLVGVHLAAVIFHRFIRKDRVVERMLPKRVV